MFATKKYSNNLHIIAKKYWSNWQKAKFRNVLVIGTLQAIVFTTIFLTANLVVLGVNPKEFYSFH